MTSNVYIGGIIVGLAVVAGVAIFIMSSKNKKVTNLRPQKSNLAELEDEFKIDYFNERLTSFAIKNNIEHSKILQVYPKFHKTNKSASLQWSKFNGNNLELDKKMQNFDGYNELSSYDKYIIFLKTKFNQELEHMYSALLK